MSERAAALGEEDDDEQGSAGAPIGTLVNPIIADAARAGASDIHVEPQERNVLLRYRIDGLLRSVLAMPKRLQNRIISRVKITASMDISERRRPQDGRARVIVAGKAYDLRVSTLPATEGETVVIRILVRERASVTLEDLGLDADTLAAFKEMLRRPLGMILVTGPTGSGKTSTLQAALNFLRGETTNIVTIEDPVEYKIPGVTQVAMSEKTGLTFAAGLRSILRQDPDVVMVGEIRDLETAQIAFQAAQTGHLILSSLHTNDAASAVTRLVEMGVPTYLVASSVICVLAQRLVRRLCSCRLVEASVPSPTRGCESCRFTGYRGRTSVVELMRLTPRVRSVVLARGSVDLVRAAARASGMQTMFQHGQLKAAQGFTSLEEVQRVVPPDEAPDAEWVAEHTALVPLPAPLSPDIRRTNRPRVLVVDDEPALRDVIAEILADESYDVSCAANGLEALRRVGEDRPDLILTDLMMPELDGLGLLRRIRGQLSTCRIPVVFLTVVDNLDIEVRALDLGADDYVTKPIRRNVLLSRVRKALLRSHLIRNAGSGPTRAA